MSPNMSLLSDGSVLMYSFEDSQVHRYNLQTIVELDCAINARKFTEVKIGGKAALAVTPMR